MELRVFLSEYKDHLYLFSYLSVGLCEITVSNGGL